MPRAPSSMLLLLLAVEAVCAETLLPSFERMRLLEENGEDSAGVSIGDLNADGRLDIVLASGPWPAGGRSGGAQLHARPIRRRATSPTR